MKDHGIVINFHSVEFIDQRLKTGKLRQTFSKCHVTYLQGEILLSVQGVTYVPEGKQVVAQI